MQPIGCAIVAGLGAQTAQWAWGEEATPKPCGEDCFLRWMARCSPGEGAREYPGWSGGSRASCSCLASSLHPSEPCYIGQGLQLAQRGAAVLSEAMAGLAQHQCVGLVEDEVGPLGHGGDVMEDGARRLLAALTDGVPAQ